MDNNQKIEETFTPLSKWIAKAFFNEQFDRTLTQKAEEDWEIPKPKFHALIVSGVILGTLAYFSKD
jgi:hypothetical protein